MRTGPFSWCLLAVVVVLALLTGLFGPSQSQASVIAVGGARKLVFDKTAFVYDAASSTTTVTKDLTQLVGYDANDSEICVGVEVGGSGNNVLFAVTRFGDTAPADLTAPVDGALSEASIVYPLSERPAPVYCGKYISVSYEAASGTPPVDLRISYVAR